MVAAQLGMRWRNRKSSRALSSSSVSMIWRRSPRVIPPSVMSYDPPVTPVTHLSHNTFNPQLTTFSQFGSIALCAFNTCYKSLKLLNIFLVLRAQIIKFHERGEEKAMPDMASEADYRKRAQECVQLAQTARVPEQRVMLLHIAETWLRLAKDASLFQPHDAEFAVPGNSSIN